MKTTTDEDLLRAAMLGYQQQLQEINGKVEEIKQKLRGPVHVVGSFDSAEPKMAKRKRSGISAAGRRHIAEAQRARWAKLRAEQAQQAGGKKPKTLAAG